MSETWLLQLKKIPSPVRGLCALKGKKGQKKDRKKQNGSAIKGRKITINQKECV